MWLTLGILVTTEPASSRSGECEETGAMGRNWAKGTVAIGKTTWVGTTSIILMRMQTQRDPGCRLTRLSRWQCTVSAV